MTPTPDYAGDLINQTVYFFKLFGPDALEIALWIIGGVLVVMTPSYISKWIKRKLQ